MKPSSNPKSTLSVEWTKGLTGQRKEDMEIIVRNSTVLLTRLRQIIEDKIDTIERVEVSVNTYEDSAYPFKQAHINGRRGSLLELLRLLDFLDKP